jgi:sortase A
VRDVEAASGDTSAATPTPEGGRAPRKGRILRIAGAACLLLAAGIAGYVAWLLWGTGIETRHAQAELRHGFEHRIDTKDPSTAPSSATAVTIPGDAVAIMVIPRMGLDVVVVEGTDTESLKAGPGHYSGTAYPWEDHGRVGIAGHRTTYGAPFWSLDELEPGNRITLETEYGIYEYSVTRTVTTGPSGMLPSGESVLAQTRNPTLVLTTCNPRFSATQRLVVFADRVRG